MKEDNFRIKIKVEQMISGEEIYPLKIFSITRSTITNNFPLSFWKCVSELEDFMLSELNIPVEIRLEENENNITSSEMEEK